MRRYEVMEYRRQRRARRIKGFGEAILITGMLLFCGIGCLVDCLPAAPTVVALAMSFTLALSGGWICGRYGGFDD